MRANGTGASAGCCRTRCPELGFRLFAPTRRTGCRSSHRRGCPTASTTARLRGELRTRFDIEVGGGLGDLAGKAWRIGLMGHSARERSVTTLLGALGELLA